MAHDLKGKVFTDQHPQRGKRLLAVTWEGSEYVVAFSNNNRTSKIRKNRLRNQTRYTDTGFRVDPNSDFVQERFPAICSSLNILENLLTDG